MQKPRSPATVSVDHTDAKFAMTSTTKAASTIIAKVTSNSKSGDRMLLMMSLSTE